LLSVPDCDDLLRVRDSCALGFGALGDVRSFGRRLRSIDAPAGVDQSQCVWLANS
jgi:hypothetical protein